MTGRSLDGQFSSPVGNDAFSTHEAYAFEPAQEAFRQDAGLSGPSGSPGVGVSALSSAGEKQLGLGAAAAVIVSATAASTWIAIHHRNARLDAPNSDAQGIPPRVAGGEADILGLPPAERAQAIRDRGGSISVAGKRTLTLEEIDRGEPIYVGWPEVRLPEGTRNWDGIPLIDYEGNIETRFGKVNKVEKVDPASGEITETSYPNGYVNYPTRIETGPLQGSYKIMGNIFTRNGRKPIVEPGAQAGINSSWSDLNADFLISQGAYDDAEDFHQWVSPSLGLPDGMKMVLADGTTVTHLKNWTKYQKQDGTIGLRDRSSGLDMSTKGGLLTRDGQEFKPGDQGYGDEKGLFDGWMEAFDM